MVLLVLVTALSLLRCVRLFIHLDISRPGLPEAIIALDDRGKDDDALGRAIFGVV